MRTRLIAAVNTALSSSGVPVVTSSVDATSADNGTFQFVDWKIVFGGASAASGQSSQIFIDHVDTVYHEARHCEQWFRIAQALSAGNIPLPLVLPPGIVRPLVRDGASIAAFMYIPLRIANLAVAQLANPVALDPIRGWFASIYGVGGTPRGVRLGNLTTRYGAYRDLAEEQDAWHWGTRAGIEAKEMYSLDYPNLYDWLLYTKRSWHFRSGLFHTTDDSLKKLDAAILAYQTQRDATRRTALKATFDAWALSNPKEAAKRDVIPPGKLVGVITELRTWLNQDRGAAMGGFRLV